MRKPEQKRPLGRSRRRWENDNTRSLENRMVEFRLVASGQG